MAVPASSVTVVLRSTTVMSFASVGISSSIRLALHLRLV
jgi:hypothetical protein